MAALTVQKLSSASFTPTYAAPTASDTCDVGTGTNTFIVYKNTSATSVTVTVTGAGTTDYAANMPNAVYTVPITNGEVWVLLRKDQDQGTGNGATITTSAQPAGLTCAAVRVG